MAKTKQTAKKSTGGSALRRPLLPIVIPPRVSRSPSTVPDIEMAESDPSASNTGKALPPAVAAPIQGVSDRVSSDEPEDWCHLCYDGSETLVVCDTCAAAACKRCIPALGNVPSSQMEKYQFKCVRCTPIQSVFYGLYHTDGSPVFPDGMIITAHHPANPLKQRVRTPSLVIIEFVLAQLPTVGTAGQLLCLSLQQSYIAAPHRLHHELIPFELPTLKERQKHAKKMARVVNKLKDRMFDHAIVIVHTHSDDSTGDLWFTTYDSELQGPAAMQIGDFFTVAAGKDMNDYIAGMKFSSFFLLACGAVVREGEALAGLQEIAKKLRFTDTFAFGAERLISHYPAVWMISYGDQVIVSGQPSQDAVENLLYSSGVGRHTSIVYLNARFNDNQVEITVSRYIWEHLYQRPNTFSYPITCPTCHCVYSWQKIPAQVATEGSAFTIRCKTNLGNGKKCSGVWEIPARPESSAVRSPYVGTWRKY